MESVSGGLADLDYCRTLERELPASIEFLEEHDVEIVYFKQPSPNRNDRRRASGCRSAVVSASSTALPACSSGPRRRAPLRDRGRPPQRLRRGRIDGVVVRGRDGLLRTLHAGAVVIASGGFEGNKEMLTQYLGEKACDLPVISPGTGNNRGEGIRMAVEVGADTAGQFDMFHAEPVDARAAKPDPLVYPYTYGIVVNRHAQRFFDEGEEQLRLDVRGAGLRDLAPPGADGLPHRRPDDLSVAGFTDVICHRPARRSRRTRSATWPVSSVSTRPSWRRRSPSSTRRSAQASSTLQLRRQGDDRPRAAEVELGLRARLAAVHRVPADLRDLLHLRRDPHRLGGTCPESSTARRSPASTRRARSPGSTTTSIRSARPSFAASRSAVSPALTPPPTRPRSSPRARNVGNRS